MMAHLGKVFQKSRVVTIEGWSGNAVFLRSGYAPRSLAPGFRKGWLIFIPGVDAKGFFFKQVIERHNK